MVEKHEQRGPHPDVDVATFVLASLDGLLLAQADIRRRLAPGRMAMPAERWHLAAASMVAARRYASELAAALSAARPPEPGDDLDRPSDLGHNPGRARRTRRPRPNLIRRTRLRAT